VPLRLSTSACAATVRPSARPSVTSAPRSSFGLFMFGRSKAHLRKLAVDARRWRQRSVNQLPRRHYSSPYVRTQSTVYVSNSAAPPLLSLSSPRSLVPRRLRHFNRSTRAARRMFASSSTSARRRNGNGGSVVRVVVVIAVIVVIMCLDDGDAALT
jgi:hypothetical protein